MRKAQGTDGARVSRSLSASKDGIVYKDRKDSSLKCPLWARRTLAFEFRVDYVWWPDRATRDSQARNPKGFKLE